MAMATLTPEMLSQMAKDLRGFAPPQRSAFLMSSGFRDKIKAEFPSEPSEPSPNPIYGGTTFSISSIPIHTMEIPKRKVFDWSGCRSPSRAKRRHARGIPQRVKVTECDVAYMFDERILSDMSGRWDRMCATLLFGGEEA